MLKVSVSAGLIEQTFRSGFKSGYLFEILNGVPMDAQICDARFNAEKGTVELFFMQPRVPTQEPVPIEIVVKSVRAVPEPENPA